MQKKKSYIDHSTASPNTSPISPIKKPKPSPRTFDPSKYSTRHIALKFAYLGGGYNGFEHHVGNTTPLPTIEEELWKALVKCRLIFPPSLREDGVDFGDAKFVDGLKVGEVPVDWEGARYSKCGRTDRGVSAFGQVIGVVVRSNRPAVKEGRGEESTEDGVQEGSGEEGEFQLPLAEEEPEKLFDPVKDELPYIPLLNKVLPPTIRVLAWCPSPPPNFDARFSCKERQYKYFFTSPAFLPLLGGPSSATAAKSGEGYLDIEAMREAASYLLGSHDFRNFCKVDPTKQMTSFTRRITRASVDAVAGSGYPAFSTHPGFSPDGKADVANGSSTNTESAMKLYTFTVQGSAFLWHQVRCMVGILFLVAQGLEPPTIVKELLDVAKNPRKPNYEMASDKPLVLWDCMFSKAPEGGRFGKDDKPRGYLDRGVGEDELEWVYAGDEMAGPSAKWGKSGIMEDLWKGWRRAKIDEVLAGSLMDLVALQGTSLDSSSSSAGEENGPKLPAKARAHAHRTRVFEGDDTALSRGRYLPVMQKERMDEVHVINKRWMDKKGHLKARWTPKVEDGDE
jgi:tRNA pseudouridine38/39 synthase